MKRPLALIGIIWLVMLAAASFLGVNAAIALLALSVVGAVASLAVPALFRRKVLPVACLTAVVALGSFCVANELFYRPAAALDGFDARITGRIVELPYSSYGRYLYEIQTTSIGVDGAPQSLKILLSTEAELAAEPYDIITVDAHLYIPAANPQSWRAKGIYLRAYATGDVQVTAEDSRPLYYYALKARSAVLEGTRSLLSEDAAELINGVLLGEDSGISAEVRRDFQVTGLSHLLAVSGTHMSALTAFLLLFLKGIRVKPKAANILAGGFLVFFMALTGFTPSVVRSGIMALIVIVGMMGDRQADALNSLGIAAVVLTIANPFAGADVGLLLSFASTLGIILFGNRLSGVFIRHTEKIPVARRLVKGAATTAAQSVAANLFILPLLILIFGEVSLIAPLSNILCLFPSSAMMLLGGIAAVLSMLGPFAFLAYIPALLAGVIAKYLIFITSLLAKLPFASVPTGYGFVLLWLAGTLLLVAAALLIRRNGSLMRTVALLSAIVLFLGTLSYQLFMRDVISIAVIDTDNGSSVVLMKNGRAAVIGCGGAWDASTRTRSYLNQNGVARVDLLILPTLDKPYASGAAELLSRYPAGMLLLPENGRYRSEILQVTESAGNAYLYDSSTIRLWDNVELTVFRQEEESVILIRAGGTTVAFSTADADLAVPGVNAVNAAIFADGLPANYHAVNVPLTLISGEGETAAAAQIRMRLRGGEVYPVADGVMVVQTRGNGDIMLKKEVLR